MKKKSWTRNTDKKRKREEANLAVNQTATKIKCDEYEQETYMINVSFIIMKFRLF